jgi:hypothetical protein
MAVNNPLLRNAAFVGFLAGSIGNRDQQDTLAADYAGQVANANAFATELDSLIPVDGSITVAGTTVVPVSGPLVEDLTAKFSLVEALSAGVANGRSFDDPASATPAFYTQIATVLAAIYAEGVTGIITP